jgi:hypothetical protein
MHVGETPPPFPQPRRHRLLRFALALFTLEIGLFLLVFPWRENWTSNYFQESLPLLEAVWDNAYFRGAISGLGLVNIYLAALEFSHFLRKTL